MKSEYTLSKSRYLSGAQCHLRLWYGSHSPGLMSAPDDALQAVFDTGQAVGEMARKRFPGGHLVAHDHHHVPEALEETRRGYRSGLGAWRCSKGAFAHEGVLVRRRRAGAPVQRRLAGGGSEVHHHAQGGVPL